MRTWIEISRKAFEHNISQIRRIIGPQQLLGIVVKSNAYGHGIEAISSLGQDSKLVDWFLTAGTAEGVLLRLQGCSKPILAMAYVDSCIEEAILKQIDMAVWDYDLACEINTHAQRIGRRAYIHLKVDTGMTRLGIQSEDLFSFYEKIKKLPYIEVRGVFTHLSDTNNSDESFTQMQLHIFDEMQKKLKSLGVFIPIYHAISSGALLYSSGEGMVRVGTNIFGFWKSALQKERFLSRYPQMTLLPILTWKSRILFIKTVKQRETIGYNRTHIAHTDMKIALVPVGYFDGYDRRLSHKSYVKIRDRAVPVIGIISMNLMAIDITHLDVFIGEEVILLGGSSMEVGEWAQCLTTIHNEIVTRINPDIPRTIVE